MKRRDDFVCPFFKKADWVVNTQVLKKKIKISA